MSEFDKDLMVATLDAIVNRGDKPTAMKPEPMVEPKPKVDWFTGSKPTIGKGKSFKTVFGWEPSAPMKVEVLEGQPDVPAIDDTYIFPKEATELVVRMMIEGGKSRLVGHPGTGKTELVKQVCARLGRSFGRINFNVSMEPDDIFGYVQIKEGQTQFIEGDFVTWMRKGYVVLFDEINRAPAAFSMCMQRVLEENGQLHLPQKDEDNLITPHDNFRMISADNTKGVGDNMDKFGSAHIQDVSSLNRWDVTIEMDYLDRDQEQTLLQVWQPEMTDICAQKLALVSQTLQDAYKEGQLDLPFSPRNLKRIASLTMQTQNPVIAIRNAYAQSLGAEQMSAVDKIVCDTIGFPAEYGRIV